MPVATYHEYECWAGDADGFRMSLDEPLTQTVYVRLPIRRDGNNTIFRVQPAPPYAAYTLDEPRPGKARWLYTITTGGYNDGYDK